MVKLTPIIAALLLVACGGQAPAPTEPDEVAVADEPHVEVMKPEAQTEPEPATTNDMTTDTEELKACDWPEPEEGTGGIPVAPPADDSWGWHASLTIKKRSEDVTECYRQALQGDPQLEGKIEVQWIISAAGIPQEITIKSDGIGDEALNQCILEVFRCVAFPPTADQEEATIVNPFSFEPGDVADSP